MQDTQLGILNKTNAASVDVTNFNHGDIPQKGQIISQYIDPSNNQVLDRVCHSEPVGTPFKYSVSDLKRHVPNGFVWGGISSRSANVTSYKPGSQTFDVIVHPVPNPQLSQIIVRYVQPKNGGVMTSGRDAQHSESGLVGDVFHLSDVKHHVPEGYQIDLTPSDYKPTDFEGFRYIKAPLIAGRNPYVKDHNGKRVIKFKPDTQLFEIGVEPIHEATQMSIIYLDSADPSHPIKKATQTKVMGSPFNVKTYEKAPYLSSDYRVIGIPQNVPAKYVRNTKPIIINVARKLAKMIINYVYVDGDKDTHLVKTLLVTGKKGEPFNVAKYKRTAYLPTYYRSKDVVNGVKTWRNNRQIVIHVVPQDVTMSVIYQLPDGKSVGTPEEIKGKYNARFDLVKYERSLINGDKVPSNYQVIGHSALPKTYQPDQSIVFIVKPLDNMRVIYRDLDYPRKDKRDRGSIPVVPKIDGTPFSIQPYETRLNVPKGYHIVSVGHVPKTYMKGGKVVINVRPNKLTPSNSIDVATASASAAKSDAAASAGQSTATSRSRLNKNRTSKRGSSTSLRNSIMDSIMSSLSNRYVLASASTSTNSNHSLTGVGHNMRNRHDAAGNNDRDLVKRLITLGHKLDSLVCDYRRRYDK